jgi:hypothetical protein
MKDEIILSNYGCLLIDIPPTIFKLLKEESNTLETKNKPAISGLTSTDGVAKHYYMNEDNLVEFTEFIMYLKDAYFAKFPEYLGTFRVLTHSVAFSCDRPWFNIQRQHEFLPNHVHDGILSFSAWITVPYTLDQGTEVQDRTGCFEFSHTTNIGQYSSTPIRADKSYEGKILMFPSGLMHCVYPFYNNNGLRISLSGNILFNTEQSKL